MSMTAWVWLELLREIKKTRGMLLLSYTFGKAKVLKASR